MAGIYIHIPFCKQQCSYCDFHFSTTFEAYRERMVAALCNELTMRASELNNAVFETVYFGGGTPSLLSISELKKLVESCREQYNVSDFPEITLECNPDDCTPENLENWKSAGVNRLSIGLQALQADQLDWMNRTHSAHEGINAIEDAIAVGFENISVDLMYGLPDLTNEEWKSNISRIAQLDVQHISAYCLTIEEKTPLAAWIKKGKLRESSNQTQSEQFLILVETLQELGFEQYEISNFARKECYSKHNTSYWLGIPYVGIGPSAHGYNKQERYWNKPNNQAYMKAIEAGLFLEERETLSDYDRFNELLMIGLRTKWGVSKSDLENCLSLDEVWINTKNEFLNSGEMIETTTHLVLSVAGRLRADAIASNLFKLSN